MVLLAPLELSQSSIPPLSLEFSLLGLKETEDATEYLVYGLEI